MKLWMLPTAAVLGLLLGLWLGRGHKADPVILAGADSVLADTKPAAARRDTVRVRITQIVKDTVKIQAAEREAARQRATADSALALLGDAQTAADSIGPLRTALHAQTRAIASLDSVIGLQKARFGALLAADSAYRVEAEGRIGRLEGTLQATRDELAKARKSGPCQLATVSAGWSPITGRADLLLGGSCRIVSLVGAVF